MKMKSGEYIVAKKHADLLNQVLGTTYKQWMKSGILLRDGRWLWMIRLSRGTSSAGWRNYLESNSRLIEEAVNTQYEDHLTYIQALKRGKIGRYEDRAVFDIIEFAGTRRYVFRGIFKLNKSESTEKVNVWDKIADEYCFCK